MEVERSPNPPASRVPAADPADPSRFSTCADARLPCSGAWLRRVILKRAVETTDGHRWTQIRRTCENTRAHPEGERLFREKSVFICAHLWFPFSSENSTAGFR